MKSTNDSFTGNANTTSQGSQRPPPMTPGSQAGPDLTGIRTTARDYANPVDYEHPYESMSQLADLLALRYDANRTRHAYYRQIRLVHEYFSCDPTTIAEPQLRDYFLHVKLQKHWKPKTIRQALAATRLFFVDLCGHTDWTLFSQIRARDHDTLPAVLTRQQVHESARSHSSPALPHSP